MRLTCNWNLNAERSIHHCPLICNDLWFCLCVCFGTILCAIIGPLCFELLEHLCAYFYVHLYIWIYVWKARSPRCFNTCFARIKPGGGISDLAFRFSHCLSWGARQRWLVQFVLYNSLWWWIISVCIVWSCGVRLPVSSDATQTI